MKSPKHQLLAQSVSQSAGTEWLQNKIDDDDIDSRERAVVKHWLIQSLAGGSFTSLYPVRQTTREAESQFVGFTSCILPICICLFFLDSTGSTCQKSGILFQKSFVVFVGSVKKTRRLFSERKEFELCRQHFPIYEEDYVDTAATLSTSKIRRHLKRFPELDFGNLLLANLEAAEGC